MSVSSRRMEAS